MAKLDTLPVSHSSEEPVPVRARRPFSFEIRSARSCILNWVLLPLLLLTLTSLYLGWTPITSCSSSSHPVPTCLAQSHPIPHTSLLARQQVLARTLHAHNLSAYISEPSPTSLYLFNISASTWRLSERPFMFVLTPDVVDGKVEARVSVVVPQFEEARARDQAGVVVGEGVKWVGWEESEGAYGKVAGVFGGKGGRVVVDEAMRVGVMSGIQKALRERRQEMGKDGWTVEVATKEIKSLRERKSKEELELLKCANELTLHAIKATRHQIKFGMTEYDVSKLLSRNFGTVGMEGDGLVLFGENAALPHGGSSSRRLTKSDLVLIDAGGSLHGYVSDITRTFALPGSKISAAHLKIWDLVHEAQAAAYAVVKTGVRASQIDDAAREVMAREGLDKKFTHRLGHGIGLEGHEEPYLNAGNTDFEVQDGNSFSNEPGCYIEGEVGVRLEDCWYMDDAGRAVAFTPQAVSPWEL